MNLLILSIGSNPMPNFITAAYLLHAEENDSKRTRLPKPDKIIFVYSSETEKFKRNIVSQLNLGSDKFIEINLEDKFREFSYVKKKVLDTINKLKKKSDIESIHLNYTGGTKPMAIGISSAVEDFKECGNKIYSDLSPDKFKLILHDSTEFPTTGDIRNVVNMSVEDLYKLHGLEKPGLKRDNSDWYSDEFIDFLIKEIKDHKHKFLNCWKQWPGQKKDKGNRSQLKKNSDEYKNFSTEELNNKLIEFKNKLKLSVKNFIDDEKLNSNDVLKKLKKFICGVWLEEYLFSVLQEIKDDCGLTDIAWNVETKISNRPFEVDVIVVKGCQSFVFTCTTDDSSGLCKGKAFEGIYRSVQIGGEHSKTVLVCMADNFDKTGKRTDDNTKKVVDNIKKDMSQFDAAKNFYILGNENIKNRSEFKKNLKHVFNGEI